MVKIEAEPTRMGADSLTIPVIDTERIFAWLPCFSSETADNKCRTFPLSYYCVCCKHISLILVLESKLEQFSKIQNFSILWSCVNNFSFLTWRHFPEPRTQKIYFKLWPH